MTFYSLVTFNSIQFLYALCRGTPEGEGEVQGGQQRARRHVRRTHRLLSAVVASSSKSDRLRRPPSSSILPLYSTSSFAAPALSNYRRLSSNRLYSQFTNETTLSGPSQQHFASFYILQRRISMLYFIIILWRVRKTPSPVYCMEAVYFHLQQHARMSVFRCQYHFSVPRCY